MASCRAIHRWSLRSLIGAFLDLGLAYLFLCATCLVFLASKFLSFFHLSLPCPCNGLFGHPDPAICVQSLLVDQPTTRIQAVHNRVRTFSPFDGDAFSEGRELSVQLGDANEGINPSRSSSVRSVNANSRLTPLHIELEEVDREVEPGSGSVSGDSSGEGGVDINSDSEDSHDSSLYETKLQQGPEIDLATTIQTLKQALEKERLARIALTLELEKERNASSSAADEAMAMILRLQKEKSEIEIEARQYKRITEEKSVFDLDEMEILKEIIVRREMENLALEKELEECHKLIDGTHLSGEDINGEISQPGRDSKPDTESLENHDINASNSNEVLTLEGHEESDVLVYDVHVVDDKSDNITEMSLVSELAITSKGKETERGLRSCNKTARENLRNSEPAVYIEKFKLENEVEMLRKKLKLVQKEREKLGFTVDQNKGSEASQLRLLEEISRQLKVIKVSTETGQSSRHVSVPHQSKVKHGR